MLRSLLFYPSVVISLVVVFINTIKINYLERKGRTEERILLIHRITHKWAKFVMKLSGCKVTVTGLENIPKNQTVLFISNHQSYFDIPLLMSSINIPKGFIAKKELAKWPGISMWMRYMQCIFMDRDNMRKSAEAIVDGINILKSGYSMVIFPEGTRSKGGQPSDFKGGSFKLALKSKVPIVPITIDGTYKVLEANNSKIKASSITVKIHPSIDVTSLSKEEINDLPNKVEKIVLDELK
ncbi:lysophospholipid acyltransferase family protein [Clostridium cibarium]|uniref:1-acyl-sn-glycerol-3-phosphate acyltransferase n=1 Tax=Clostridium cibarium TaxID=2762247 RepID=A0ABR8PWM8_9CLOT|nr:lysophospholipid acyltransferase family protein [Clostridium cibarium]MBD7912558.1 1-acyl-sn-glycerol-3-phosphate acyltransferase [Clostridium cibarium]